MTYGWEYNDSPFPDYDLVVEDSNYGEDYDWHQDSVWHKNGQFYTLSDGGCSCNGPYEYTDETDLVPVASFAQAISGLSAEAKEQALKWEAPRG